MRVIASALLTAASLLLFLAAWHPVPSLSILPSKPAPADSFKLGPMPAGLPNPDSHFVYKKLPQTWVERLQAVAKQHDNLEGRRAFYLENYIVYEGEYIKKPLTYIFQDEKRIADFYGWLQPAVLWYWQQLGHHKRAQLYDGLRYMRRYMDVFELAREEALFNADPYNYGRPLHTPKYAQGLENGLHWGAVVDYGWLRAFVYRRVKDGVSLASMKKWADVLLKDLAPKDNGTVQQQLGARTQEKASYKNGKRHGQWMYKHSKESEDDYSIRVISDSGHYENDQPHGQWVRVYDSSYGLHFWIAQFDRGRLARGGSITLEQGESERIELQMTKDQLHYTGKNKEGQVRIRGFMPIYADTMHLQQYYANGQRQSEGTYLVRDQQNYVGIYREWHKSGRPKAVNNYAYNTLGRLNQAGVWYEYYDQDLHPLREVMRYNHKGNYADSSERYHTNGRIAEKTFYLSDTNYYEQRNKVLNYNAEGRLIFFAERIGSRRHGQARSYADGRLSEMGRYVNGEKDSVWVSYHPNGKAALVNGYKRGRLHGQALAYDENGQLQTERNYTEGVLDGSFKLFYPDGQPKVQGAYSAANNQTDDELLEPAAEEIGTQAIKQQAFRPTPLLFSRPGFGPDVRADVTQLWAPYSTPGIHGEWRSYHPNGNLQHQTQFHNGVAHGLLRSYDANGTLLLDIQLVNGQYQGSHYRNHPNGKPQIRAMFQDGVLDGPFEWYNEAGVLLQKGNCKQGQRSGTWQYKYPNGQAQATVVYDSLGIVSVSNAMGPDGKPIACKVAKGTGSYIELNAQGKVIAQGRLQAGKPVGKWWQPTHGGQHPIEWLYLSDERAVNPYFAFASPTEYSATDYAPPAIFDSLAGALPGLQYIIHKPADIEASKHRQISSDNEDNMSYPLVNDEEMQAYAKAYPNHAGLHYILANAYLQTGQPDEAATYYQRALALDKRFITAHLYLAQLDMQAKRKAQAEQHLQQFELLVAQTAYATIPRWVQGTHWQAAQLYAQLSNRNKCLKWLERAVRLDRVVRAAFGREGTLFEQWLSDPDFIKLAELADKLNPDTADNNF